MDKCPFLWPIGKLLRANPPLRPQPKAIVDNFCCLMIALVSRPKVKNLKRKGEKMAKIKKALIKKDKKVACPYCHQIYGGNAVKEAARREYPITCSRCDKQFQPISSKK